MAITSLKVREGGAWVALPTGGGSGGAVDSVNGETGTVVLDAGDVGAATEGHNHDSAYAATGHNHDSAYATTTALATRPTVKLWDEDASTYVEVSGASIYLGGPIDPTVNDGDIWIDTAA